MTGGGWAVNPDVDLKSTQSAQHMSAQPPPGGVGGGDAPPLTTIRARTTRVCHHLAAGTRVDVLAAAGGFKNGNMGARYVGLLTAPPPNTAAAMLRDA